MMASAEQSKERATVRADATPADIADLGRTVRELAAVPADSPERRERIAAPAERAAETAARIAGGEYRPAYNGHANRETWTVSLWLGNDEPLYRASTAAARAAFAAPVELGYSAPVGADVIRRRLDLAADALAEFVADRMPAGADMASDLLGYALACVDWTGVADGYADADTLCGRCGHSQDDHWRPVSRESAGGPRPCDACECSDHIAVQWSNGAPMFDPSDSDAVRAGRGTVAARFIADALTAETAAPAVLRPWNTAGVA